MDRKLPRGIYRRKRGDGSHYPGYYVCFAGMSGRLVRRFGGPSVRAAERKRRELMAEVEERRKKPMGSKGDGTMLFSDFVEQYRRLVVPNMKAAGSFEARLRRWVAWLPPGFRLGDFDAPTVHRYRQERQADGAKPKTINNEVQVLQQVLNTAASPDWGFALPFNPIAGVKRLKGEGRRTRSATGAEASRLLDACQDGPPYLFPLASLALNTGLRQGELFSLRWENVNLDRRVVYLTDQKNGQAGDAVPLNQEAVRVLREWRLRSGARHDHVFTSDKVPGQPLRGWQSIRRAFSAARTKAGLEGLWFHDLRRTWATLAEEAGVSIHDVSKVLRHSNVRVTERYAQVGLERKRGAVEALSFEPVASKLHQDAKTARSDECRDGPHPQ